MADLKSEFDDHKKKLEQKIEELEGLKQKLEDEKKAKEEELQKQQEMLADAEKTHEQKLQEQNKLLEEMQSYRKKSNTERDVFEQQAFKKEQD